MRLYIIAIFILLILGVVHADYALQQSPVNIENYFNEGTHYNTRFISNHLELQQNGGTYYESGYWISPIFYVSGKALWNHMEGSANWDEFDLNLIENGGFETNPDQLWSTWGTRTWDCNYRNTGSCSYLAAVPQGQDMGLFRSKVVYDGWNVVEHHNTFPVAKNDAIHFTARIDTEIPQGTLGPTIESIRTSDGIHFYKTSFYRRIDGLEFSSKTNGFIKLQGIFNLTGLYPNDTYTYYGYPQLTFDSQGSYAPQRRVWIDDILVFRDSRITIQARISNNADCSGMPSWTGRPETLLYNNEINVPAVISKCIQFKINLKRIDSANSPELSELEFSYSNAYNFTRPIPDTAQAAFTKRRPSVDELGPISLNRENGELYFDGTGENVRLYGFQVDHVQEEGPFSDPQAYADYICGFAEKYGYGIIKWGAGYGRSEATIRSFLEKQGPFVEACRNKGVYFFYRFTPLQYLDSQLGHNLNSGGFDGPVEFTDNAIIDKYKQYVDIILNYQYNGRSVGNDHAFVFAELMNEITLMSGWRFDKLDGINNDPATDQMPHFNDIAPYYAGKLKELFNQWVRNKYPTYNELRNAWGTAFVAEDGNCATYPDQQCNLVILKYSQYAFNTTCAKRIDDTIEFLLQREEYFYTEMKNYIQSRSHMYISGGKPRWGLDPPEEASTEVLDVFDRHPYGVGSYTSWAAGQKYYITVENTPLMRNFRMNYLYWKSFSNTAFVAGETSYNPFSENVAEFMLTPVIGANSGWDAIIIFILSLNEEEWWNDGKMGNFNLQRQSPLIALQPVSSRLFSRDIEAATVKKTYLTRESARNYNLVSPFFIGYKDPANQLVYSTVWGSMKHTSNILPDVPTTLTTPYQSSSGDFIYDIENRRVKVVTQGTVGVIGDYDARSENLGFMSFTMRQKQGIPTIAVFLTSLDNQALTNSKDMLLTLVGNAGNSKHLWDAYHNKAICDGCVPPFGSGPAMMAALDAQITLNVNQNVTVFPLTITGKRTNAFQVTPQNNQITFNAGSYPTPWYEIVVFNASTGGDIQINGTENQTQGNGTQYNITECINGDFVCPENCTFINDDDCPVVCANNDTYCPQGCTFINDNDCEITCTDNDGACPGICNITNDNDCPFLCNDTDNDGYYAKTLYCPNGRDCDDTNSSINPNAADICGNGVDENCDMIDEICVECPIEGQQMSCLKNGCPGTKQCVQGYWTSCVKTDSCCGIYCDDNDASTVDTCFGGLCLYELIETNVSTTLEYNIILPKDVLDKESFTIKITDMQGMPIKYAAVSYNGAVKFTDVLGNVYLFAEKDKTTIEVLYKGIKKTAELKFKKFELDNRTIFIGLIALIFLIILAAYPKGKKEEF